MVLTTLGEKVEKEFNPKLQKYFGGANSEKYLFAITAPWTRSGADFRVQIEIYEKIKSSKKYAKTQTVKYLGYVQVTKSKLKNLDIPELFLKIGEATQDYIHGKKKVFFQF